MALTLAQLQAYVTDQNTVQADQSKLTADQATESTDAATIAAGLTSGPVGYVSADGTTFYLYEASTEPPGFTVTPIPIITT